MSISKPILQRYTFYFNYRFVDLFICFGNIPYVIVKSGLKDKKEAENGLKVL